jgi:hypothetical protein
MFSYNASYAALRKIFAEDIAGEIMTYLEDPVMKWQRGIYKHVMDEFKSFKKDKNRKTKLRKIVSFAKTKKQWTIRHTIAPMIRRYWKDVAAGLYPNKRYRPSVMTRQEIRFQNGQVLEIWTMKPSDF